MERERERPARDPYEGLEVRIRHRPNPKSNGLTTFHSKRVDPEAAAARSGGDRSVGGFLRRNRSLTLTLIDVSIVIVLFGIYWFVLRPMDWQTRIEGFRFRATATVSERQVDIRVRVDAPTAADTQADVGTRVVSVHAAGVSRRDLAPEFGRRRDLHLRVDLRALDLDAPQSDASDREPQPSRVEIEVGLDQQRARLRVPLRTGRRLRVRQGIFR